MIGLAPSAVVTRPGVEKVRTTHYTNRPIQFKSFHDWPSRPVASAASRFLKNGRRKAKAYEPGAPLGTLKNHDLYVTLRAGGPIKKSTRGILSAPPCTRS